MTQNIEQRTEVAVKKYEGASDTVNQLAETDAIVNTGAGTRKSFPKISQEWDDESNKLKKDWGDESSRLQTEWSNESAVIREDWQTERNELSTKALGVKPWESGQSETNINQQRRWTDNHTYLPKSVPAVMDAVGPDDNWIPYTAERAGVLSDVFGRKPIDLVVGLVITPNAKKQYPKLNAFGKVWELVDGTMTITVKAYQESSDGYLIVTLDDDSQVIGEQVEGATRSWSFSNLISAMKGGEPESELDNMNGSDQVLYRRNPNAPYVSVANRLRAQKLNLVGDLKAPDDNTGDVGQQIQEFLEFGGKKLEVPDGIFQVITPVLIHGSSGLSIEGFGPENTIFTAGSNLLMDTRRLESLDIDLHDEYNKHAIFHITQFDGENDRPGYAARNHVFSGIGGDFTGSPAEKIASLLSSPHLAHTEIKKTLMRAALSTYEAWNLSDNSSRHYHLLFKAMRSIDCIHHVKNDYKKSASTSFGTTWIFDDNSLSRCKYGYELHGLNYSTIRDSSVDNNLNGSYAVDIYKGRGIALRNVGIETRLHHIDTTTGGGILRVDNANVDIRAGFYVGGDRDGKGNGVITDYDDGSGNVSDSLFVIKDKSVVKWDVPTIDARKGPPATPRWPIHVEGDSRLEFVQAQDGSGDILTDFDVKDTSTVEVTRNNGTKAVIFGPDTQSKYLRMSHYVADYFDNEKFVGRNESIDVASETMLYRVNFGALGLEDYTVLGMPENWAFGQLHVTATDLYVTQDITLTKDGSPSYRRVSVDRGQTWKSWSQIG